MTQSYNSPKAVKYGALSKIGYGMSSEVFKSTEEHHKPVCVKIIKEEFYESTVGRQLIDNEISILQELAHPNILKFLNRQNDKSRIVLVTEYCEGGDLGQLIKNKGCVDESRSYEIMSELVEGCLYLHNMDIIHRDLKPENIFFTMNRAKIADFGFAVRRVNKHILAINVGSPLYMAPYTLSGYYFSFQSDIFALGVIWYEMLTGKLPWSASSESDLLSKMLSTDPNMLLLRCGKDLVLIIKRCLHPDKDSRPSLEEIHRFIAAETKLQFKTGKSVSFRHTISHTVLQLERNKPTIFADEVNRSNRTDRANRYSKYFSDVKNINNSPNRYKDKEGPGFMFRKLKSKAKSKANSKAQSKAKSKTKSPHSPQKYNSLTVEASYKSTSHNHPQTHTYTRGLHPIRNIVQRAQLKTNMSAKKSRSEDRQARDRTLEPVPKTKTYLMEIIGRLDHYHFSFLPHSLQHKLKCILKQYSQILSGKVRAGSPEEKDTPLYDILKCETEEELCSSINSFFRRLIRLAKSYKKYTYGVKDLNAMMRRIESLS